MGFPASATIQPVQAARRPAKHCRRDPPRQAAGGEINCYDSGAYGAVTITKIEIFSNHLATVSRPASCIGNDGITVTNPVAVWSI